MTQRCTAYGWALATATLLGLTACGGDGGDAPSTATTFSGVAATGAAMANATVSIKCVTGAGTATTTATGSYSTAISGITLPCAIKAASADGTTVLYSVITATSAAATTQVANITPLTQLVIASLTGTTPATLFDNFSAATATAVTPTAIATAQAAVRQILADAGIATSSLPDLLTGTIVAGGTTDAYDLVLEAVHAVAPTPAALVTLTETVAAASPAVTTSTTATVDHTPRLPASQLLKTAAANCSALRSGEYVVIQPQKSVTLADQVNIITFSANTLAWTRSDGSTGGTFAANGNCQYTGNAGADGFAVSQAGIVMGSSSNQPVTGLTIAIPKQTIAIAELAGSWNALGFEKNDAGTAYVAHTVTADVSSTGTVTNVSNCAGAQVGSTCTAPTATINIRSNSAGGFDLVASGTDSWTDRLFAYRAGSGDLMLVSASEDGTINVWTKQRTTGLPTVGDTVVGGWFVRANNQWLANALGTTLTTTTYTSVDAASGSYVRTISTTSGVPDYAETILINTPRAGFNLRNAGTTTSVFDARTVSIRERTSLPLRGMGVSFQSIPSLSAFQMSVD